MELGLQLCLIQRIRWIFTHLHLRMEWEQHGPGQQRMGQYGRDQVISVKGWEVNGHRLGTFVTFKKSRNSMFTHKIFIENNHICINSIKT